MISILLANSVATLVNKGCYINVYILCGCTLQLKHYFRLWTNPRMEWTVRGIGPTQLPRLLLLLALHLPIWSQRYSHATRWHQCSRNQYSGWRAYAFRLSLILFDVRVLGSNLFLSCEICYVPFICDESFPRLRAEFWIAAISRRS